MNLIDIVGKQIELNPNLLYMSGNPDNPGDAVTRQIVDALLETGVAFSHVNISVNSEIATAVEKMTGDRDFPQLFIGGRYAGRPTVILTMHHDKKLEKFMSGAIENARISAGAPPVVR